MNTDTEPNGYTGDIQAVRRVADIIGLFSLTTPRMTVAEAAQRVGLNRTTVHRYFSSMVAAGLLERDPEEPSSFVPGSLVLQLGAVAQGQRRVLEIAPRHMRELSNEVELTTVLSLWGRTGPVVSLVAETMHSPILVTVRVGTQLSLESAQTRVFLAFFQSSEYVESWIADHPSPDLSDVRASMAEARATGTCRALQPTVDGVVVAAPIFDHGRIAASIAVVGTRSSLPTGNRTKERALTRAALAITEEMGGTELYRAAITTPG